MKYIVTTDWLAEHVDDDNLRIVDIRGKVLPASEPLPHYFSHRDDYIESHIPGAVFVDWTTDIVDPQSPSYDVASPDQYAALMGKLGIDNQTKVIVYDDAGSMFAARFLWTLRYYGHENAAILDGGWQKWLAESHPVTAEIPKIEPTVFTPNLQLNLRITADEILRKLSGNVALIDVRSLPEFNGQTSRAERKGRIPGAINIPRKSLLADDMTLLPLTELRMKVSETGIADNADNIVVYCNSGVSASFIMLALQQLGYENIKLYDGSWKEWGNDPTKPIER